MMRAKIIASVILICVLATGCQNATAEIFTPFPITLMPTFIHATPEIFTTLPITLTPTFTHVPTLTYTPVPTITPEPLIHRPELISQEKLSCTSLGTFTKCVDDVLNIEFEYPTIWGEIEAVLRTGGYSGYAYDYFFGGKTIAETEPLVAGGRSKDFSEGRGAVPTDFAGYGNTGIQLKESCDPNQQKLFPICQKVSSSVAWMIRLPNAEFICNSAPGFHTAPVFRIEVDIPDNQKINGLVFEAPFYSEQSYNEVKSELYPLLGLESDMMPASCDQKSQQAFDAKLEIFLDHLTNRLVDSQTLKNLDALTHLANAINFR